MLKIMRTQNYDDIWLTQIIADQGYPEAVGFFSDRRFKFDITQDHLSDDELTLCWVNRALIDRNVDGRNLLAKAVAQVPGLKLVNNEVWLPYPVDLAEIVPRMQQLIQTLIKLMKPYQIKIGH